MEDGGLKEFQRNATFAIIVFLVGFASFVYLATNLADVLVPLIWAAFFAIPLTGAITKIDRFITASMGRLRSCMRDDGTIPKAGVKFTAQAGENRISIKRGQNVEALMNRLQHPCESWCISSTRCCQSSIQITKLERNEAGATSHHIDEPEVNRLVHDWHYYVKEVVSEDPDTMQLELYLDQEYRYPAVISRTSTATGSLNGCLNLRRQSTFSWFCAVMIALVVLIFAIILCAECIILGVQEFQANLVNYRRGLSDFIALFTKHIKGAKGILPENLETQLKNGFTTVAARLAATATNVGVQMFFFLLYLMFWIFEPISMNSNVAQVIKSYLLLKSVVCLVFAIGMALLLYLVQCPLWAIFFVISFLLNYIPEIGFLVVFILGVAAVLLDGRFPMNERVTHTLVFAAVSLLLKVVTANILEVQMYTSRGGQYMRMHPVVMMAMMVFFEKLFGMTGMFLSIPISALLKYYLLAAEIPAAYLHPALMMIEGEDEAPHKNFVDRHRTLYGTTSDESKV